MTEYLFDAPWWILGVIAFAGIAVWWTGNQRQDKQSKIVGLALLGVAILIGICSWVFQTPRERAVSQTEKMVAAVGARDWPVVKSILDARTSLSRLNDTSIVYKNREQILAAAKAASELYGFQSARVSGTEVDQHDTIITVTIRVYSVQEITSGQPVLTDWQIDWNQIGQEWRMTKITLINVGLGGGDGKWLPNVGG